MRRAEENPKKVKTREQVEKMQRKAVNFLRDVVGNDDKADAIGNMSLEDYAAHKHVTLSNPRSRRGRNSGEERCRQYHDRCVPMGQFAYVGDPRKSTTYKLRLDNKNHVRDAMARFSRTRIPRQSRRKVAEEIARAARTFGIDASGFEAKYLNHRNPDLVQAHSARPASCVRVTMTAEDVQSFNKRSGNPSLGRDPVSFDFDPETGDLLEVSAPEGSDADALDALAEEAWLEALRAGALENPRRMGRK